MRIRDTRNYFIHLFIFLVRLDLLLLRHRLIARLLHLVQIILCDRPQLPGELRIRRRGREAQAAFRERFQFLGVHHFPTPGLMMDVGVQFRARFNSDAVNSDGVPCYGNNFDRVLSIALHSQPVTLLRSCAVKFLKLEPKFSARG